MRKQLYAGVFLFLVSLPAISQETKHDLSISMARLTPKRIETWTDYVASKTAEVFEALTYLLTWESVDLTTSKIEDISYSGGWFITYRNQVFEKFFLGGTMGYERNTTSILSDNVSSTYEIKGYTLAVEAEYFYIYNQKFQMYSGGGIGILTQKHIYRLQSGRRQSKTDLLPNFQINALGLRFGNQVSFFTEFGFGYKGIMNFGVSFWF